MSSNNPNTSSESPTDRPGSISRRQALGIGTGAAAIIGGIILPSDFFSNIKLNLDGSNNQGPATTPRESQTPDAPRSPAELTTPWEKSELVISYNVSRYTKTSDLNRERTILPAVREGHPTLMGGIFVRATKFWNTYLEENTSIDLTLTFKPDATEPDILLHNKRSQTLSGKPPQYTNPGSLHPDLRGWAGGFETLEETPDNLPVEGWYDQCGNGIATTEMVVKHVLGRLIGIDMGEGPNELMHRKWLFGLNIADDDKVASNGYLWKLEDHFTERSNLYMHWYPVVTHLNNTTKWTSEFENDLKKVLDAGRKNLDRRLAGLNGTKRTWAKWGEYGKLAADTLQQHVINDGEIATVQNTLSEIETLLEEKPPLDSEQVKELHAVMKSHVKSENLTSKESVYQESQYDPYTETVQREFGETVLDQMGF